MTLASTRGLRGIPSMASNNNDLTSLATNTTNADVDAEVFFGKYYEKTEADHRRMIFMILFFLGFMILYIGFCAYYRKRNKVRRAVEDTTTVRTRERQRSNIQIALDESSDAARRARTNAHMQAKLKKRLANIKSALYVRIIVNDHDIIDDKDEEGCMGAENGVEEEEDSTAAFVALKSKLNVRMWGAAEGVSSPPPPITPALTIIEEEDEDGEEERGMNAPAASSLNEEGLHNKGVVEDHSAVAAVLPQQVPSSLAETRSAKSYIDALNCSGRKSNSAIPARCDDESLTKKTIIVVASTSSEMNWNYHRRSIPHSKIISMHGEECNICLSQFQVGDRAAWSLGDGVVLGGGGGGNNDTNVDSAKTVCKHVFHEECITRWLLVRDKCPICRATYFSDNGDDLITTANSMSDSSSTTDYVMDNNGNALALGRGESSNDDDANLRSTPLIRRMIERFDIG